jgi:hypothetical protein
MAAKKRTASGIAAIKFTRLTALLMRGIGVVFVAVTHSFARDGSSG